MADLPPIPDEAAVAHRDAYVAAIPHNIGPDHHDPTKPSIDAGACMESALEAAWPHLYAAALRHAADEWLALPPVTPGTSPIANWLRRLADSATP